MEEAPSNGDGVAGTDSNPHSTPTSASASASATQLGDRRPSSVVLGVGRIALRLVRSLVRATAPPAPQPFEGRGCLAPCAPYTQPYIAPSPFLSQLSARRSPRVRQRRLAPRLRGFTNRANTTAAAGALKCRPSSFMRRVSTQPTDGCRGRPDLRASWKRGRGRRRRFARVRARERGRRRRKRARLRRRPRAEDRESRARARARGPRGGGSTTRKRRRAKCRARIFVNGLTS